MSYGWEAACYLFVENFVWIFREYYFLLFSLSSFHFSSLFFVNWLQCLSIGNILVMHMISENSQISTSSRFRNSSGYVFFLLRRIKKCFALPHFAAFSTFCVKSF